MKTYQFIFERVTHYTVDVEAPDLEEAMKLARTALDDEEGGPEAWPNEIKVERILSANTI
jgi:hypothetical protein